MNYSMILYVVGWVLNIEAALMLPSVIVGVIYRENAFWSLLISAVLCLAAGGAAFFRKPKNTSIYSREGFVIVAFSWIALSIFGAFPFVFSGAIPNYVDALFETVSGAGLPDGHSSFGCRRFRHVYDEGGKPGTRGRKAGSADQKHGKTAVCHVYFSVRAHVLFPDHRKNAAF